MGCALSASGGPSESRGHAADAAAQGPSGASVAAKACRELCVCNLGGPLCVVQVQASSSLREVKEHIQAQTGIPAVVQTLLHGTRELCTDRDLARLPGGMAVPLTLMACVRDQGPAGDQLRAAAKHGDTATVRALLSAGAEADGQNLIAETPLHLATRGGHAAVAAALLAAGAAVDEPQHRGSTALHYAASAGHCELIQALLVRGAALDRQSVVGTPLHCAAGNGHFEAVAALLAAGARANRASSDGGGATPLHCAAGRGHEAVVLALLSVRACPERWVFDCTLVRSGLHRARGYHCTALHVAAQHGHHRVVAALVAASASVNAVDQQHGGLTPLGLAEAFHRNEVYRILAQAGARS